MKTNYLLAALLVCVFSNVKAQVTTGETVTLFDHIIFYDGYAALKENPDLFPDEVLRHSNELYAVKLTEDQLVCFGEHIKMRVTIGALCDNYDRVGSVNLAMVPKGQSTYVPTQVDRIELGRFITPFMNKNREPNEVTYTFDLDYLNDILREETLLRRYDFWVEFEVFGVPYAANNEISGCHGRDDVFEGTLSFETLDTQEETENGNVLLPLFMKNKFNNYTEGATDKLGTTVLTKKFTLSSALKDAKLVLVTSNHGANMGGEEFFRRWHYVSFDDEEVLRYLPGRNSCEPFRKYNTQGNAIYGKDPRTDKEWQSFSNWCPGDVIDNRIVSFDLIREGTHTFRIEVPDAQFADKAGDIPISLFLLGKRTSNTSIDASVETPKIRISPNPVTDILNIHSADEPNEVFVYNMLGRKLFAGAGVKEVDMTSFPPNTYMVVVRLKNGTVASEKVVKK